MSLVKFRIFEAIVGPTVAMIFFCAFHFIEGSRPLITEFEAGALWGFVLLKLIEAVRAYADSTGEAGK